LEQLEYEKYDVYLGTVHNYDYAKINTSKPITKLFEIYFSQEQQKQRLFIISRVTSHFNMGAILNLRSAAIIAAGGDLSWTAALITWRLRAVVHSAPLWAAVTGKVYTKKDISFRFPKEKES